MQLITNLIGVANKLTQNLGLQDPTVTVKAWLGQAGDGAPSYAAPATYSALVDLSAHQAFTPNGQMVEVKGVVTFLQLLPDVTPNAGQKRINPIDPHDVITLPDGTTGPAIMLTSGLINPDTHRPYMSVVGIGK